MLSVELKTIRTLSSGRCLCFRLGRCLLCRCLARFFKYVFHEMIMAFFFEKGSSEILRNDRDVASADDAEGIGRPHRKTLSIQRGRTYAWTSRQRHSLAQYFRRSTSPRIEGSVEWRGTWQRQSEKTRFARMRKRWVTFPTVSCSLSNRHTFNCTRQVLA